MKGKIRKVLGVGLVLALVLSLSLVMAAPVPAASPADTDVGFEFGIVGTDTVEWSDTEKNSGAYSVLLTKDNSASGSTHVDLALPSGITVNDLEALTNEYSFWYSMAATSSLAGPQLELLFASPAYDPVTGAGRLEITFVPAQAGTVITDGWHEVVVDDATPLGYGGQNSAGVGFFEWATLTNLDGIVAAIDLVMDGTESVADWELIRVRAELYEIDTRTCYIDDITIDGTLYELEPIFLDAEYYSVGDTVEVTVPNFKANTDPIRVNPVTGEGEEVTPNTDWEVSVTSTSDLLGTTVALEETGADTGVFTASFTTVDTLPAAEDELYVEDGNTITVAYDTTVGWGAAAVSSTTLTALVDDTAPTITGLSPADDAMTVETAPTISASYSDTPAGIDQTSVEMLLDGEEVVAVADGSGVTYTPTEDLVDGTHDVTVNVSDNAGNEATESWSFRIVSWLAGPVEGTVLDGACLDALDTVGVEVCIFGDDDAYVTVGRYASNPEPDAPPTFTTIEDGFFDVKVTGADTATLIVIKFADDNITAESTAYVWGELEGEWLECSDQGYNPTDEFLWVKVRDDTTPNIVELGGTPFAISGEPAEFDPWIYDVDDNGEISKTEALNAIVDYFGGDRTKDEALQVIALYFAS